MIVTLIIVGLLLIVVVLLLALIRSVSELAELVRFIFHGAQRPYDSDDAPSERRMRSR